MAGLPLTTASDVYWPTPLAVSRLTAAGGSVLLKMPAKFVADLLFTRRVWFSARESDAVSRARVTLGVVLKAGLKVMLKAICLKSTVTADKSMLPAWGGLASCAAVIAPLAISTPLMEPLAIWALPTAPSAI